jgi:hypothetical protein
MKLEPSSVKVAKNFSGAYLTCKEYYFMPLPPFHEAVAPERHRERETSTLETFFAGLVFERLCALPFQRKLSRWIK